MMSRKPHTPWSTSNADYGRHIEAVRHPQYVNYRSSNAITGENKVQMEKPNLQTVANSTPEGNIATNVKVPLTPKVLSESDDVKENAEVLKTQNPKLEINTTLNDHGVPIATVHNKIGDNDKTSVNKGLSNAPSVRHGLPSRGPARRFMQEQCGRLLDNIQTLRGVKNTAEGRVQVLTVDHAAETVEEEGPWDGNDPDTIQAVKSAPSSAKSFQ